MSVLMVANCPKCGKVFQKNLRNMCQDCMRAVDGDFQKCYSYLRMNRKATTEELNRDTGVSVQQITLFIKDNRLPLIDYPNLTYACASCGGPIRRNNICVPCATRLTAQINDMKEKEAKKHQGVGFHSRRSF
ncbi:flagellar protein [Paenibacillus hamazuiensis]|uniref:flagellar protein n=1 Tax=Paenibacillus hamazuiensis TaxID=2936508 RepID=UPI00200E28C0|nr:flagellar protein [Paenibacillus hamazuiensis]